MPRNLLATGLITPTTWEPANLGPEGTRLAELTLRSLAGIFRSSASDVYVCENPSILVTAADALGPRSIRSSAPTAACQRQPSACSPG